MDYCKNCDNSEYVDKDSVFCKRYQKTMGNFDDCNKNITTKELIENVKKSAICNYGIHD